MGRKVYCVDCQRLVRSILFASRRPPRCFSCACRASMSPERWLTLKQAGLFARTADGRGQLGG